MPDLNYLAAWSWVLGYTAVLASLSVLRHHLWLSTGYDLGLFEQDLWLLAHRGLLALSTYTGHPALADGVSYVLLPLAPLYNLAGVGFLLVLQAFALGMGYFWIRRIGRALGINERHSHLLGLTYLVYPTVLGANLFDFHPEALGVPVLFGMVWAAVEERWTSYALLALAALLVKDTAAMLVVGIGIVLLLRKRVVWGLVTLGAGVAGGYVNAHVAIPHLMRAAGLSDSGVQSQMGGIPLPGSLGHLQSMWNWVGSVRAWEYLAWLFGPCATVIAASGIRALNPWWIPGLILIQQNLQSHALATTSPFNQMSVLAVPFFFAAALAGLRTGKQAPVGRKSAALWLALPILFLAAFIWQQLQTDWEIPPNADALQVAVESVPVGAPVVAQNFVAAHLADRDHEWTAENARETTLPAGTYVILDQAATRNTNLRVILTLLQKSLAATGQAETIFSQEGVTVYRLLRPLSRVLEGAGG